MTKPFHVWEHNYVPKAHMTRHTKLIVRQSFTVLNYKDVRLISCAGSKVLPRFRWESCYKIFNNGNFYESG